MVKPYQKIKIKPNWLFKFKLHTSLFVLIFDPNGTHLQNDFLNPE